MQMRIAIGQLWQETNTFNPLPTTRDDFESFGVLRGEQLIEEMADTNELGGFIQSLRQWPERPEIRGLVRLPAWPSGRATAATFDWLRSELLNAVERSLPVDGMLLALHGALVAEEHFDVEGEILAAIRALIGTAVPMVATLDLHAHVTPKMAAAVDALVLYHTAPHVDVFETGQRGAAVLRRILIDGARPVTALATIPCVLPAERANTEAACGVSVDLKRQLRSLESRQEVLAAGLATVQPWLDVPQLGSAAVVTTDDQPQVAETLCRELAAELWRRREEYLPELFSIEEAIARAFANGEGLVVLSDAADATTSGSPGDSVWVLQELLKYKWHRPVLVPVVAPQIVQAAERLGVGQRWTGSIGGERDTRFGFKMQLSADVERIFDARFVLNGHLGRNLAIDMGRSAVLQSGQIRIIATSRSGPHFAPELFQAAGFDPFSAAVVVAKSPAGFRAVYSARAAAIYCVRAPGCAPSDFWNYEYREIQRPLWPWDEIDDWQPQPRLFRRSPTEIQSLEHG
jgi:microcystin degradation protein MlrC